MRPPQALCPPPNAPVLVDLVNLTNGQLKELGSASVPAGTYHQLRLVLADTGNSVTAWAALVNVAGGPHFLRMNTTANRNLVTLSRMLERLDCSTVPVDPRQYRGVVEHLSDMLLTVPHDAALDALLDASPATAELYENLHYEHAGLCRSALEPGLNAELAARAAIDAARKPAQPKA